MISILFVDCPAAERRIQYTHVERDSIQWIRSNVLKRFVRFIKKILICCKIIELSQGWVWRLAIYCIEFSLQESKNGQCGPHITCKAQYYNIKAAVIDKFLPIHKPVDSVDRNHKWTVSVVWIFSSSRSLSRRVTVSFKNPEPPSPESKQNGQETSACNIWKQMIDISMLLKLSKDVFRVWIIGIALNIYKHSNKNLMLQ